ncbi:hypothetical protein BCON_0041g00070 [Botryotinia convoluta]|uniref:Uncharacterized protein n=1 Tax=Botryotinia convoluta TaxID=54673 RepID=A0A4Z1ISK4_9HELO|nr:hypothetical protein BCON_0041g00070 [Botryotinia convoluta]
MTRYGFSQRQRARKEARTLSNPHSPSEVPSPWWAPLVQLRRLKFSWFHRFRPRCSNSISSNESNVPNESVSADESGAQERVTEDDQNLQSMINSSQNNDLASDDNNNISSRSASPVSPTLNDMFKVENTMIADGILAGENTAKSKDDQDVRQSSNTITDPIKHANTTIRGGGNVTDKTSGANGNRFTTLPLLLKTAIGSKSIDEELTFSRPTKNWVTRFKDSQKAINPHRRQKYKTKSPKGSVRKRVLRRLEYKNLGIELSYAEVKRADWKPRDHMTVDSRIGNTRKPEPGCSNLRYCLTYLKQVKDTVSDFRKAEWADKEIAKLNQLIAKEENEMRGEARLTRVSNSIDRTQSPRNFLASTSQSQPHHQVYVAEPLEPPQTTAESNSSQMPDILGRWGSLETYSRFNFEALQHALKQALTGGQRNDDGKRGDQMESTAETGANDQKSELEVTFLKDSDEENEGVEEDGDEDWEEYFDCEEKLSDEDYFLHDRGLREGMSEYINDQTERSSEEDEPQFAAHLFSNPLQSLEDQENNHNASLPNSTKPNKPSEKRSYQKLSRTWITRFLAKKAKGRRRRMPRGPGRFIYPSSENVLLLHMNGISTNGARPTRGDTEKQRDPERVLSWSGHNEYPKYDLQSLAICKSMIMIMSERDRVTVSLQEKKSIKDSMEKVDRSSIESTRKSLQTSTSRREVMDPMDTTIVDTVQNSTRNDITMKNDLGEEMKMNLDFGSMRSGPPSSGGDSEEENESETLHFNLKELNSG